MSHLFTTLAHAGLNAEPATGALIPPIHLATTYERNPDGSYPKGYQYARDGNPTRRQLETTLARLEGGCNALAFSSGMAACTAILQAVPPDSHVILPEDVYHGVRRLALEQFAPRGLEFSSTRTESADDLAAALQPNTGLVWIETPSNPLLQITDIRAFSERAHAHDAIVVVDGTWTTPVLQHPFELGADLVLHSLTKYFSGHSDVLGGAVVTREASPFFDRIIDYQKQSGAVLDPFSSWLVIRGIRTLGVRLAHQCANAHEVASFLNEHVRVSKVYFPGLPSHPGHRIARRQMSDFGAMLSFEVDGNSDDAMAVAAGVKLFRRATSLGGTESLIEHRASMEGPESPTPDTLLRLSIGLEHSKDLMDDLDRALGGI